MVKVIDSKKSRIKRRKRIRAKISGTAACPRLSVFRSAKHSYAQIIDDEAGKTLCSASTEAAKKVGLALAEKAKAAGISDVVFDRSGYVYHGRVAALADGAREGGLNF